jgi:hypothetical protein
MSHSVGLSAPRVAQNAALADGSNVGLNGAVLSTALGREPLAGMGSLVPPCSPLNAPSGETQAQRDVRCSAEASIDYVWSATDLQRHDAGGRAHYDDKGRPAVKNLPVEYGAIPLRSFGDAVKHPVHGLVGALVIGPRGSEVCADARRSQPGGTSRAICGADGKRLYGDHVLVMQDAVSAMQGGLPLPDLKGAEEPDDYGVKAINYKTEPLWARRGGSPSVDFGARNTEFDYTTVFSSARQGTGCEAGMPPNGNGGCTSCTPVVTRASKGSRFRATASTRTPGTTTRVSSVPRGATPPPFRCPRVACCSKVSTTASGQCRASRSA